MKPKHIIMLLLIPIAVSANNIDSLSHRFGLLAEFDGNTIDQVGIRYRLTNVSNAVLRINFGYYSHNNDAWVKSADGYSVSGSLAYEYSLYRIESVSMFMSCGVAYGRGNSEYQEPAGQPTQYYDASLRNSSIAGSAGIGLEYCITGQLSLFIHQNAEWSLEKENVDSAIRQSNATDESIHLVNTVFGLTIYL